MQTKVSRFSQLAVLAGKTEEQVNEEKNRERIIRELKERAQRADEKKDRIIKELTLQLEIANKEISKIKNQVNKEIFNLNEKIQIGQKVNLSNIQRLSFLEKRIVSVYGNGKLFELYNHVDFIGHIKDAEAFKKNIMSIRPHF